MNFYTVEQLGPKRQLTPEGFLLCEDVAIARIGWQVYGPDETPLEPGPDGLVHIERRAEEVFRAETIASFNGKPIVEDHPPRWIYPDGVTPDNWKELSHGTVLNPRRDGNFLRADLLVQNQDLIREIEDGKRQLSCGYQAKWFETEPGKGYQAEIVGNHVALVEKARCGAACSIGDSQPLGIGAFMTFSFKKFLADLRGAVTAKDLTKVEGVIAAVGDAEPEGGVHIHTEGRTKFTDEALEQKFGENDTKHAGHDAKFTAHDNAIAELKSKMEGNQSTGDNKEIEGELKEEAPEGTGDKAATATDSSYLEEAYQATLAGAEILAPGIHAVAFDKAMKPMDTYRNMCGLRRKALQTAARDAGMKEMLGKLRGGRLVTDEAVRNLPCGSVRSLFHGLTTMKKAANNLGTVTGDANQILPGTGGGLGIRSSLQTPAALNKANEKKYHQAN